MFTPDRSDVGMIQLGESQCLTTEALSGCFVGKHAGWEHLDGYFPLELLVGSPEHEPHSAGSDLLEYAVMTKDLPDNWSFRRH
jgi:hypothetical protein